MAFVLSDRIKETTTTTGTGTYTLGGAVSGFETFTANLSNSDTTYYCCTDGTDFEVGLGTFTSSGTTLARTTIISSSNSNNAVSWSSGSRDIFCTLPGSKAVFKDGSDNINGTFVGNITGNVTGNTSGTAATVTSAAQPNITSLGTLTTLTVDDITINGSTISDGGDLTLDAEGDIILDANGAEIRLKDNGTEFASLRNDSSDFLIRSAVADKDIKIQGVDGSSTINAVTFDMSDAGAATFNHDVTANGNILAEDGYIGFGDQSSDSWGKLEFLTTDPTGFSSQFDNAVSIVNEQGSTNQRLFLLDTGVGNSGDLFGVSSQNQAVFSVLGSGDLKFKRPNGNTTHDITLACPTPSAARTVTLPDATGTFSLITATETLTNKTLTSPKINEDVAVTSTATEINKLDGVTATTTELNYVDVTTLGTVEASKAVTADSNGDVLFPDNEVLQFGTGGDLKIFHNPNNSIIQEQGSGSLFIDASDLNLRNGAGSATYATFTDGGAAELNHNNVKKFETTSAGATVTGDLTVTSTDGGGGNGPILDLYRNSPSPSNGDHLGTIQFNFENDADQKIQGARIYAEIDDDTDGTEDAAIFIDGLRNGSTYGYMEMAFGRVNILSDTLQLKNNASLSFEGATTDDSETFVVATDPTADRTITLPDATGTVLTTGNSDTPTTTTSSSDADFVLVDDGGTMKKITPANLGITSGGASKGFAVAMAIAL